MIEKIKGRLGVICFWGVLVAISANGRAAVRAWEGSITIPTYGWEEDINPKFWALEGQVKLSTTVKGTIVYPYTMQDHLSRIREDRTYKALFLENEFLKITCLPELGGRLHSVLDKTENKEVFHANQVIKPSMIAMRGAFISGGVEWNAGPQVHTVTIVSPVNALIGTNPDGSAYLQVSNLEMSLRTRWTVRVTLHPGKAYLDEEIRIVNPTDAINPYYFWNCTAFPCREGTRFIYPMTLGTDHNGVKFFNWPIHEGKDLSWLKNYEIWASIFAVNCAFDFFGAYDIDADRGVVQVADHHELSGKKAWTWGTWDFGLVSQKNLTDEDGPYIEVQSGPLPTQSDYGLLLPRQEVSWREWWYPVHGLGDGFEYATRDLAFQTSRKGNQLELRVIATDSFDDIRCTLARQGKMIVEETFDLSPAKPKLLHVSEESDRPVQVTVRTSNGQVLAEFTTPLPIPVSSPPARPSFESKSDEQLTIEELFLKGQKYDLAMDRTHARKYYEKALAKDAEHSSSLRNLAVLDYEGGLYANARDRLREAVKRNPADGPSWYFLGLCQLALGDANDTLRCGYQCARCFGAESLGFDLAGRALMRVGDRREALKVFEKAVAANPKDDRILHHSLIAQYFLDEPAVFERAQSRIQKDPTDLVPRAILALRNHGRFETFAKDVRAYLGEDDFEMIEVGLLFTDLGLYSEAAELLDAVCVRAVSEDTRSPLPLYYIAYFHAKRQDPALAQTYLKQAAKTWKDFVFPSRPEMIAVFQYAIAQNPDDAYARLHLGNLYAHLGRLDEAVVCWQNAVRLNPSLNIGWRNLGLYHWAIKEDLNGAADLYRKAITARPKDQTLYRDLADILIADNKRPEAITVLESTPSETLRRADIIIMLAQAFVDEKRYSESIDLLEGTPYFVNWEGQSITWDLFNRSHLERGKQRFEKGDHTGALRDFEAALTYPANIGVGRSNQPREAPAQYWRGKALAALGRKDEARSAWKLGAAGIPGSKEQDNHIQLCHVALQESP
ncbi:MAG: DUF5107 domain-containing protein [Phycisphaerae bacterium]|nr:DUF5107 domain-containing protein [Phycisphaerae bacterium]